MTELLSSFDLFCNSIVDILLQSDDRNFLSLKLLLMYNNVCSIPFENINAYMSLFYDKLKYPVNKNIGYLVYSNPIHVCLLLAYTDEETCKQVLSIMLSELNIIPCGYPILFNSKNDLVFYSSLFGANAQELELLKFSINQKITSPIEYIKNSLEGIISNDNQLDDKSASVFTDIISIKYNDIKNKLINSEIIEHYKQNKWMHPQFDNIGSYSALINETSRSPAYNEHMLRKSLRLTMHILSRNESKLDKCIAYIVHKDDDNDEAIIEPDFNIKRIAKNIFIKQMNLYNRNFKFKSTTHDTFIKFVKDPQKYFDLVTKCVYNDQNISDVYKNVTKQKNYNMEYTFDTELTGKLLDVSSPVALAHYYRLMFSHFQTNLKYVNLR